MDFLYDPLELDYSTGYDVVEVCPSEDSVELFENSDFSLVSGSTMERCFGEKKSKYDLNWSSVRDFVENWGILSNSDQRALRMLIHSDVVSNVNKYGLKAKNLASHLLLHIGCDMNNIVNSSKDSVLSNLKSASGLYSEDSIANRHVDAKTCLRASRKFNKEYSVETLFKAGFECYQATIVSDNSYRKADKEKYQRFFKENSSYFSMKLQRTLKIYSYLYSHEVSVDSILREEYRPHTHIIFFVPRGTHVDEICEIERKFNSSFSDRVFSLVKVEKGSFEVPKVVKKIEDIEKSVNYLFRSFSLSNNYAREVRNENIRELNKKTVECYRTLIYLMTSEEGFQVVRRFNTSHIPKRTEVNFKHPLLQKAKKPSTIEKLKAGKKTKTDDRPKQPKRTASRTRKDGERSGLHGGSGAGARSCYREGSSTAENSGRGVSITSAGRVDKESRKLSFKRKDSRDYKEQRKLHKSCNDGSRRSVERYEGRAREDGLRRRLYARDSQRSSVLLRRRLHGTA